MMPVPRQAKKPHVPGRTVRDPCAVLFFFEGGGWTGGPCEAML